MNFIKNEMAAFKNDTNQIEIIERMSKIANSYNDGDLFATSVALIKFLSTQIYFNRYNIAEVQNKSVLAKGFENFGRLIVGCKTTVKDDFESAKAKVNEIRDAQATYKFDARLEIAIRVIFGYFIGLMIDLSKLVVGNTDFYCIKTNARVIREINDAWNTFEVTYNQLGVTA